MLGIVCASALAEATPNKPSTVGLEPPFEFRPDGGMSPTVLSKTKPTPVELEFSGKVKTRDGSRPPALQKLTIDFDTRGTADVRGLPACHLEGRPYPVEKPAKICEGALIGSGTAEFQVSYPEEVPMLVKSDLQIYNGGLRDGLTTFYISASIPWPIAKQLVAKVKIKKIDKGRYGSEAVISVPTVAGEHGSLVSFNLAIKRRLLVDGKWFSPVTARCPDGKLQAHFSGEFFDYATNEATAVSTESLRTCTGR
jgi:hypothetical protein